MISVVWQICKSKEEVRSLEAKQTIIKEFKRKLSSVIKVNNMSVSYNTLILKDCLSLRKYIVEESNKLKFFRGRW